MDLVRTAFICTINPTVSCWEESHNTLRFGSFAKKVTQTAVINETMDQAGIIHQQKKQITELSRKLEVTQKTLQVHERTLEELQQDNEHYAKLKQQLEMELAATKASATASDKEKTRLSAKMAQVEQALQQAQDRIAEMEPKAKQADELQQSLKQLRASIRSEEDNKEETKRELLELSVERDTLQSDRDRLRQERVHLQRQMQERDQQLQRSRMAALCNGVKLEKKMGKAVNGKTLKTHPCTVWLSTESNTLSWKSKGMTKKIKCIILSQVTRLDVGSAYHCEEEDGKQAQLSAASREMIFTTPMRVVSFIVPDAEIMRMCVQTVQPLCTNAAFQLTVAERPMMGL